MEKGLGEPMYHRGDDRRTAHILIKGLIGLFVLTSIVALGAFYVQLLQTVYRLESKLDINEAKLEAKLDNTKSELEATVTAEALKMKRLENETATINRRIVTAFSDSPVQVSLYFMKLLR